jgi:hypothetical protein
VGRYSWCRRAPEAEGAEDEERVDQGAQATRIESVGQPIEIPGLPQGGRRSGDAADLAGRPALHAIDPADGVGIAAGGDHVEVGEGVRNDSAVRKLPGGSGAGSRVVDQQRPGGGGERGHRVLLEVCQPR